MWPANQDEFREWLGLARELALSFLPWRLRTYPIVQPNLPRLTERAIAAAARVAERRWRHRQRFPDHVAGRIQFTHWFAEMAHRECLRRLPMLAAVRACLAELAEDQRRLLLWLYVDQLTFAQGAQILRSDAGTVRQQSLAAYSALRSRIVVRSGEQNDNFPMFPAAVGHGL
jgi:hypothetical protein